MNKKIEDYLHLYLGCECECRMDFNSIIEKKVIDGMLISQQRLWVEIKPLLRPLSSITEDECLYCANIISGHSHLSDEGKAHSIRELFSNNGFCNKQTNLSGSEWLKIINHLRSVWVDMDDLITAGLAIDKTSTK